MNALSLAPGVYLWLGLICFVAGLVRGFSGFALSAVAMSVAVLFLPPVEMIPILWWQEMTASMLMLRGGWQDADRRVTYGLVIGSAAGLPLGLWLTNWLTPEPSKLAALLVIMALAAAQLARVRMRFLATRPGLYGSGVMSGIVTGIAGVGGMVVALYVLARESAARQMRGSLVLYLFLSSLISMVTLVLFEVMTWQAMLRGLALAPFSALGVMVGKLAFRPAWEPYYKPFCLVLLLALAFAAMARLVLT